MTDLYLEMAEQQLGALNGAQRLVVLHPNFSRQHQILSRFIEAEGAVYVRLDGKALDAAAVDAQVKAAVQAQVPSGQTADVQYLILDECDRVQPEALVDCLETLLGDKGLPTSSRIIIVSRVTPAYIEQKPELRHMTSFLPVDQDLLLCDYTYEDDPPNLLEVHALGPGRVYLGGKEVNAWDGVLPRSLFFYLVDRGMTTRSDIFDIFWSKLTTREATNVFHVTKRKISEVLGIDLTVYWAGFYRISPDIELSYDVMKFTQLVQDSAVAETDEAEQMLLRAIELYRGPFLREMEMDWAFNRRTILRQTYGDALVALAKIAEDKDDEKRALGLYLRASAVTPHREDLVQKIMGLYGEMGHTQDALHVYERLADELDRTLGVKPAPHLRELADKMRHR